MNSKTQDMKFRQSLIKYAEKYGVSRASRKYNKTRSFIYFWKSRWDGSVESLATQSRRPHHHPNEHTEAEIKLIKDHRRICPDLELPELWHRLRKKGYSRCITSLYRVMKKYGMLPHKTEKKKRIVTVPLRSASPCKFSSSAHERTVDYVHNSTTQDKTDISFIKYFYFYLLRNNCNYIILCFMFSINNSV